MATLQENVNIICRELKRFVRVTRYKQNVCNARSSNPTYTNNQYNIEYFYQRLYQICTQVIATMGEMHDLYILPWATKWSLTTPTGVGELQAAAEARLRRLLAVKVELAGPCATQGFTEEDFATGTSYADTMYRPFSRLGSDASAMAARMNYLIKNEIETKFPNQNAREFAPILERIEGYAFQLRTVLIEEIQQDASRRGVTAYDIFEMGEAVYGRKLPEVAGGLYLLNRDAICGGPAPDPDPYNTKVSVADDLPALVA